MFAVLAVAMTASAVTLRFIPGDAPTPYDWNSPALWINASTGASVNRLPTSSEDVSIVDAHTRENPLFINAGTAAVGSAFYFSTTNKTLTAPMLLTINGGTLSLGATTYVGYKAPAVLTVQNGGAFSTSSAMWLGVANSTGVGSTGFDVKILVADANSSVTGKSTVYIANQSGNTSLIENHGSVNFTGSSDIWMGYSTGRRTLGNVFAVIDNYGTITATDNRKWFIGGTMGYTGIISNHVGAVIDKGYAFCIGSGSNTIGRIVNEGTINGVRFSVGGCTYHTYSPSLSPTLFAQGYLENSGTINASGFFRVAWQTNSVGHVENTGDINGTSEYIIGYSQGSKGYFRHSAGNLDFTGSVYVGYQGYGYLELAGNTETVFDKSSSMYIAQSGTQTSGELVITNSATLSRGGKPIIAASSTYGAARIALYDDAVLRDVGQFRFGNVRSDSSFEVYDNAVVSNVALLVLNVGTTSSGMATGTTRMRISGNARVCDVGDVYVGSNTYNHAELEIADNAWFGLCDDAGSTNRINVARDSMKSGDATIRMRGGTIGLGIKGSIVLGSTNNNSNVGCTSHLVGYGCVTNQGDWTQTLWSRLDLRGGSVTADGEGEERDLDLKTIARLGGAAGEGRSNLNVSGTNGWYAINKGRLIYPNRDGELVRFVGDYARLASDVNPKFVNSMKILIKNNKGDELTAWRKLTVELYAPDRTDFPAGLVADDDKNRRLGIWKGSCYCKTNTIASAEATIRYDQWRLFGLKDGDGNYPPNLDVRLYRHDGKANGKWKCIASCPVSEAASNGYRITGKLESESGETYNLGWFAVVAKANKGTMISIR